MQGNLERERERERENQGIRSKCTENSWTFKNQKTQKLLITFFGPLFGIARKPFSKGVSDAPKKCKNVGKL
jgi:hypothetical protein